MKVRLNGSEHDLGEIDPATPLLWALRDSLGLTGTKFGCGMAQCGACTVHVDGEAMRACSVGIGGDSHVRTQNGSLLIGPERLGSAMAFGGPEPTPTDANLVNGEGWPASPFEASRRE